MFVGGTDLFKCSPLSGWGVIVLNNQSNWLLLSRFGKPFFVQLLSEKHYSDKKGIFNEQQNEIDLLGIKGRGVFTVSEYRMVECTGEKKWVRSKLRFSEISTFPVS